MKSEKNQVFISYRRNGSDAHARVFYEKLKEQGFSVFLDFESLFSGGFEKNILSAIDNCQDFVLLLPKHGLDRCQNEDDLLRKEIRQAIISEKNILPVFINGFEMPEKSSLPSDIASVTETNGIECSMEYFDAVFEKLLRNLNSQPRDNDLFIALNQVKSRVLSMQHAYFKKWASFKLNEFLSKNDDFFDGTNYTNPHAEDTFGVTGIEFTEHELKAITAVSDYWQDSFTIAYLQKQEELIKRGVSIYRVFVIEEGKLNDAIEQMNYQYNLGIKVYYIEKSNGFIDPAWLVEDYLIQDNQLVVEIFCTTHQFDEKGKNTERITMDIVEVQKKIERFQRIIERSILYIPKSKS